MRKEVHGAAKRGQKRPPEYNAWSAMIQRCYNPNSKQYKNYGARGISVCERWRMSFENFFDDMGARPAKHSIDRIDNNGNYEASNCRWATHIEQQRNKTTNANYDYMGVSKSIAEWAEYFEMPYELLKDRLSRRGWNFEKAISIPVREYKKRATKAT